MKTTTNGKRTLVLGSGSFVRDLLAEITMRPRCGYRIIGIVAREPIGAEIRYGYPVLGMVEDLNDIIQREQPEVIIVAFPHNCASVSDHQLLEARVCRNIKVELGEAVFERLTGKLPIETFAPGGVIYSDAFQPGRLTLLATRLMSLLFALGGLLVFAPLMLMMALVIKLDSQGPVFFIQERVGYAGKPFRLLKFRTMSPSDKRVSEWEDDNVHRITRVGRWLRKFRLDELPQFLNILKGDMNLVGPRPHPASSFELFVLVSRNTPECGMQIPYYSLRYSVLPGITGWAQVRYQYANSINEEIEKLRFDLYYLKHYSLWFDLAIIVETIRIVFAGHYPALKPTVLPEAIEPVVQVQPEKIQLGNITDQASKYARS